MYLPPDTTDTVVVELAARIVPIYALYMLTSASMWAIRGNLNGNQNPLPFPAILRRTAATVLGSIWRLLFCRAIVAFYAQNRFLDRFLDRKSGARSSFFGILARRFL